MISSTTLYGVVAQLVERYPEEVGVGGSSPSDSATSGYSIMAYYDSLPSLRCQFDSDYPLFLFCLVTYNGLIRLTLTQEIVVRFHSRQQKQGLP